MLRPSKIQPLFQHAAARVRKSQEEFEKVFLHFVDSNQPSRSPGSMRGTGSLQNQTIPLDKLDRFFEILPAEAAVDIQNAYYVRLRK
jgi:hypothetical protein